MSTLLDMDRVHLKQLLDQTAAGADYIENLFSLLLQGPERELKISADGVILTLNEHATRFSWDPRDPRTAVASLVISGEYEPTETRILETLAKNSRLILDIGANVGYYAVKLGRVLPTGGRMICFEPLPTSLEQLRRNIELNGLSNLVSVESFAVSDQDGIAHLHVPQISGTSASSMRNLHPDEVNDAIEIKTRRRDMFLS